MSARLRKAIACELFKLRKEGTQLTPAVVVVSEPVVGVVALIGEDGWKVAGGGRRRHFGA